MKRRVNKSRFADALIDVQKCPDFLAKARCEKEFSRESAFLFSLKIPKIPILTKHFYFRFVERKSINKNTPCSACFCFRRILGEIFQINSKWIKRTI